MPVPVPCSLARRHKRSVQRGASIGVAVGITALLWIIVVVIAER
jgi:hypothetical protein